MNMSNWTCHLVARTTEASRVHTGGTTWYRCLCAAGRIRAVSRSSVGGSEPPEGEGSGRNLDPRLFHHSKNETKKPGNERGSPNST